MKAKPPGFNAGGFAVCAAPGGHPPAIGIAHGALLEFSLGKSIDQAKWMSGSFDLKTILGLTPKFHFVGDSKDPDWEIHRTTCVELNERLKPGMKTLETGAGLSTVIFAANRCDHACIMPDAALADRVRDYCRSAGIETGAVRFIIEKSCDAMPQIDRSAFDLILIDGCHGFPTAFVDFYYAARALKLGGTLIVDDMQIYTCHLIASFMQSDPGWTVDLMTDRVAFCTKIADTLDANDGRQPFVVQRSASRLKEKYASLTKPVATAEVAAYLL